MLMYNAYVCYAKVTTRYSLFNITEIRKHPIIITL